MTATRCHLRLDQKRVRLGLLSDSHGNVNRTRTALRMLADEEAEVLLHAGDIGSEGVLDLLAEHSVLQGIPVICVLGNVDLWNTRVEQYPAIDGLTMAGRIARIEAVGIGLAVVHGDAPRLMHEAMNLPGVRVIITGHTHVAADRQDGTLRILNPGALHRASVPSCATLDLPEEAFRLYRLS